ncbi:MAG: phosphatidate cytidylyltransferase [Bacteroidales bacterium]|nr:phosphatidate cytidylyltransferase [Bacteroidales bacterium]
MKKRPASAARRGESESFRLFCTNAETIIQSTNESESLQRNIPKPNQTLQRQIIELVSLKSISLPADSFKNEGIFTMNNLITRTLYGIIFAIVVVGSIFISPILFAFLMLVVTIIGTSEMNRLFGYNQTTVFKYIPAFFSSLVSYCVIVLHAMGYIDAEFLFLLIFPLFFPFVHSLFSTKHNFTEIAAIHYASVFFVAVPSALTLYFYNTEFIGETAGPLLLLSVIGMIWVNDIFAYLIGSKLGRHRLYERISPKKSWEGSIGGLLFTLGGAALYANLSGNLSVNQALSMAAIVVVFGSLGDLTESMLKRQAGVKDSGNLIPGHGGILDRFDATFFAVPFVFVYLIIVQ